MTLRYKLGRLPRRRDPRVPHFSALTAGVALPTPPAAVDYTAKLPASLGMFHNDSLGDCTCAAVYHAFQVWSANAQSAIDTEPDQDAVLLYEQACGYNPSAPLQNGQNPTDQGGVEQDVLTYIMLSGAPMGPSGAARHRIAAFVEIDPRNFDDVKLAIADGGLVYIGFSVPSFLPETPGATWDVQSSGGSWSIVGGHAVIAAGYDAEGLTIISWGTKYKMTWAFWSEFVDEAYLLADQSWIEATGKSPAGLSLADLETQMQALNDPGASQNSGSIPVMRAPTGLMAPVPDNPRLGQLARERNAAHARATVAEGRAARAEGQVEEHTQTLARVNTEREQHAGTIVVLREENAGLKAKLAASEAAREKAERACQDAQQAVQEAKRALQAATEAAQRQQAPSLRGAGYRPRGSAARAAPPPKKP